MKKIFIILAFAALVCTSCEKEQPVDTDNNIIALVKKTFTASMPSTKTTLDGVNIRWSEGDKLSVLEFNSSGEYIGIHEFNMEEGGAGQTSASFTGEVESPNNTFIAIYPNNGLGTKGVYTANNKTAIDIASSNNKQTIVAVENGFDPKFAIMTATCEQDNFVFNHAVAYLKFYISVDDIQSIKISTSGNARIFGRQQVYTDGQPFQVESAKTSLTVTPASGTFVKDSFYLVPITIRQDKDLATLTLDATNSNGSTCTLSADLSSLVPAAGTIYNLGTPRFTFSTATELSLNKTVINNVPAAATTGLIIEDAYVIVNGSDSDITVAYDGAVSGATIDNGNITYSVSENTNQEPRIGRILLSIGDEDAKIITINQLGASSTVTTLVWDFSSSVWQTEFAKYATINTNVKTIWNITLNGLHFYANASGNNKYNAQGINCGGSGSTSNRVFTFTAPYDGTVLVSFSNTGNNGARHVIVVDEQGTQTSKGTESITPISDEFQVSAGQIYVYPDASLWFYSISFSYSTN